jgi:chemotaxis response regulator CheB
VICDSNFSPLAGRIKSSGYRVARVSPEMMGPGSLPNVDAWVVDCDDTSAVTGALAWVKKPVVAYDSRPALSDRAAYKRWVGRVVKTLDRWTVEVRDGRCSQTLSSAAAWADVEGIWVLAGAEGTDDAVVEFLESLPWVPPVAMIYAQHAEGSQVATVEKLALANSQIRCALAQGRHWLNPGHLLVTPNSCRIVLSSEGVVTNLSDTWGGHERPNIDQLVMELMGLPPGSMSGLILFSGDCSDGLQGGLALRATGARVWAQTPDSAIKPGLPQAAQRLRLAANTGSPAELAADLAGLYAYTRARVPNMDAAYPDS